MAQLFSLHLQLSVAQSSSTYWTCFEALQDGAASRCAMAQLFSLGLHVSALTSVTAMFAQACVSSKVDEAHPGQQNYD